MRATVRPWLMPLGPASLSLHYRRCLNLDWAAVVIKAMTEAFDTVSKEVQGIYKDSIAEASSIESLVQDLGDDVAVSGEGGMGALGPRVRSITAAPALPLSIQNTACDIVGCDGGGIGGFFNDLVSGCFPGSSLAHVLHRGPTPMHQLRIGDRCAPRRSAACLRCHPGTLLQHMHAHSSHPRCRPLARPGCWLLTLPAGSPTAPSTLSLTPTRASPASTTTWRCWTQAPTRRCCCAPRPATSFPPRSTAALPGRTTMPATCLWART